MTPSHANIFMDRLERQLISQAAIKPRTWWRFTDHIFIIWTEGEDSLKCFIEYLNSAHRMIKFTSKWSCSETEFLDVRVIYDSGKLETDVCIKPTDSHQYVQRRLCHPNACNKGISFAHNCVRRRRMLPNAVEIDILGIFEGYSSLQICPPPKKKFFRGEIIQGE